jgi:hypothetical protein
MPDATCISAIDWTAVGSVLQGIGSILGPIAVAIAAWIGGNTFKVWRQQKLSERRIEQAERILTATYNVRRGLAIVRNPAMFGHELAAAEESLKKSGEWDKIAGGAGERRRHISVQAYYNRFDSTKDDRLFLEMCQPMARALFGEDLEKAIEILNRQFWKVRVSVGATLMDERHIDANLRAKINADIYEAYPSSEENEMDKTITEQVKIIERICVPVLRLERGGT